MSQFDTIYLDNSATTPLWPEVREAMLPWLSERFGNPSSIHALGRDARVALEEAREVVAAILHVRPSELVFTSGATEANNTALKGWAFSRILNGDEPSSLTLLHSSAEHHAILEPAEFLGRLGTLRRELPVSNAGSLDPTSLGAIGPRSLLSATHVNNEVGTINAVAELAERAHAQGAMIHTDAVQAMGKLEVDLRALGVDLASVSAHKLHGPKGIGALYIKSGTVLEPLLHGGAQERNRRGGTESVALAIGFATAAEITERKRIESGAVLEALANKFRSSLCAIEGVVMNSPTENTVPTILNFSFTPELLKELDGEAIIMRFDLEGIAVSNGAACTSGSIQPSHVLLAMGKSKEVAAASVRVSLSYQTTEAELERFIAVLRTILG